MPKLTTSNTSPSSDIQPRSVVLAIAVHVLLGGLLWWGATWVQPKPIETELWDAASLGAALNPQPVTEPTPQPEVNETTPPVVKTEETVEPAEIETKTVRETQPEKTVAKPKEPPVESKVTAKTQPTKPTPTNKPNTAANDSARNSVLGNAGKVAGGTGTAKSGGMDAGYVGKVKSMIESRGRNQGLSNASGSVSFRVAPNGSILNIVASITPADKKAVLESIIRGINLPRPVPDEAMSRGMRFSVRF